MSEKFLAGSPLHDLAQVHDSYPLRHIPDRAEPVRNKQIGYSQLLLKVFQEIHDLCANGDIKR